MKNMLFFPMLLLLITWNLQVRAQHGAERLYQGVIRDSTGKGIADVNIRVIKDGRVIKTDSTGSYKINANLDKIQVEISHLNYKSLRTVLSTKFTFNFPITHKRIKIGESYRNQIKSRCLSLC